MHIRQNDPKPKGIQKMKIKGYVSLILTITLVFICLAAVSCSETVSYKSDIAVSELAAAADAALPEGSDMTAVPDDYIIGMMQIDVSAFEDHVVKIQASGINIDEYGIFKAPSEEAVSGIKDTVSNYLTMRLDTWMEEYMPEEKPKLQSATVKVMGRYVVYCILSEDAKTDVFGAVDNLLLGK